LHDPSINIFPQPAYSAATGDNRKWFWELAFGHHISEFCTAYTEAIAYLIGTDNANRININTMFHKHFLVLYGVKEAIYLCELIFSSDSKPDGF